MVLGVPHAHFVSLMESRCFSRSVLGFGEWLVRALFGVDIVIHLLILRGLLGWPKFSPRLPRSGNLAVGCSPFVCYSSGFIPFAM